MAAVRRSLYRGEVCCAQGRFADAEIYGYQALYASLQRKNACVTYGAALLLGTNAVYRGDLEAWKRTLDYLEDPAHTYAFLQDTFLDVCMKETVQSYFAMLQPKESRLRKRLQAASNRLYDLNFTNSAIKGVRIPRIILKKNYHKAIGILEVALKVDARLIALPSRLFIHTNLALCYFAIGRSRKAAEHLEFTLSLAERDQVLSFAAYFRELSGAVVLSALCFQKICRCHSGNPQPADTEYPRCAGMEGVHSQAGE